MEGSMIFCQENILEHSLSFFEGIKRYAYLQWGKSDIVIHHTNNWNKVYSIKKIFHYKLLFSEQILITRRT
jgi:hypothetical protein